jgi:hypothetical protein
MCAMKFVFQGIILSLLIVSVSGCKKDDPFGHVGSYDWYLSIGELNQTLAQDNVSDRYGLEIQQNGRVLFFKNGKLILKEKIETQSESYIRFKDSNIEVILEDSVFICSNFPFEEYNNYFFEQ